MKLPIDRFHQIMVGAVLSNNFKIDLFIYNVSIEDTSILAEAWLDMMGKNLRCHDDAAHLAKMHFEKLFWEKT